MTAVPPSQNTAPVAEFRCLFTHDVRRKQKRWQDGFLKFHSFNNRVMVYDDARNFLGDTYYKDSNELYEGDELNLDKGVMVQVAEAMGVTQTDLTPLFEKKTKESPNRAPVPSQTRPFHRPTSVAPSQLRHKSLNSLLGAPKGPIGKAMPIKSPYEIRKEKENELTEERAPKRQKIIHGSASCEASIARVDNTTSRVLKTNIPSAGRGAGTVHAQRSAEPIPPREDVIILDEPGPGPVVETMPAIGQKKAKLSLPKQKAKTLMAQPLPQTPRIPRGKVPVPSVKALQTPERPPPPSSPPVSASNRLTNVDYALQPTKQPQKEPHKQPQEASWKEPRAKPQKESQSKTQEEPQPRPRKEPGRMPQKESQARPRKEPEGKPLNEPHRGAGKEPQKVPSPVVAPHPNPKAKSLRLSVGVKRGTLLCQKLPQFSSTSRSRSTTPVPVQKPERARKLNIRGTSPAMSVNELDSQQPTKTRELPKGRRRGDWVEDSHTGKKAKTATASEIIMDSFDNPEIVHGFMDQQLIIDSSPELSQESVFSFADIASGVGDAIEPEPLELFGVPELADPETTKSRSVTPVDVIEKMRQKKPMEKPKVLDRNPLRPSPVFESPPLVPRDVSPAKTDNSGSHSRNTSISPTKTALSTGGFKKKPKRALKNAEQGKPIPEDVSFNTAVVQAPAAVGPRKGPLMTTTELANLLQKTTNSKKAADDPIEDDSTKSPNRSFRRVQSENDAPIPSNSADWEKRNLSKGSSNLTEVDNSSAGIGKKAVPPNKDTGLSALIKKTDPRRKFRRTQSLSVKTNVPPAADPDIDIPSPVIDTDVGPWSTEAFDLFDWKPPGRD